MKETFEFAAFLMVPTALFALLIGGLVAGQDYLNARSCGIYTQKTGIETHYIAFDECYLKTAKGWMPWSEFKSRAMTKEI